MDTIFALSSGPPPAAIAIIRLSGPQAHMAAAALLDGRALPAPRCAGVRTLVDPRTRQALDEALLLLFSAGESVTGEAMVEIHCHGGRAVVASILSVLGTMHGLRPAVAGEFTRRAMAHGRMDLNAVEGLADLLAAETEAQRRSALAQYGGAFSARLEDHRLALLALAARLELLLDFSDEGDVVPASVARQLEQDLEALRTAVAADRARPSSERLRDGIRVVIAGPVNSGKSTLLNRLAGRDAAIVSDVEGTTRDLIEVPLAIGGVPFVLIDTAGERSIEAADAIERIGMERATHAAATADILLWLGEPTERPRADAIRVLAQVDRPGTTQTDLHDVALSAVTGEGLEALTDLLLDRAAGLLPGEAAFAISARQRAGLLEIAEELDWCVSERNDLLLVGEHLRSALAAIDRLTGRAATEDMLDALFGQFCIGK